MRTDEKALPGWSLLYKEDPDFVRTFLMACELRAENPDDLELGALLDEMLATSDAAHFRRLRQNFIDLLS